MTISARRADATRLDERLCLALSMASRAMTARYRPLLSPLGLTYPQYLVMLLLWQEGGCSVGGIGEHLRLESSTLSPLLKRLESVGLITRARDTHDERSVIVDLTMKGRSLERRTRGVTAAICEATGLDAQQQAEFVANLRSLATQLQSPST